MSAWLRIEAPVVVEDDADLEQARCILAEGLDVVIDMYSTSVITSAGCQAVRRLHDLAVDAGRKVTVVGPHRSVLDVMRITGVAQVIDVIDHPGWSGRPHRLAPGDVIAGPM